MKRHSQLPKLPRIYARLARELTLEALREGRKARATTISSGKLYRRGSKHRTTWKEFE